MSRVFPLIDGWVGYGNGVDMLLRMTEPLPADHPLVVERPELFSEQPAGPADTREMAQRIAELEQQLAEVEAQRAPSRPSGGRSRPKAGGTDG